LKFQAVAEKTAKNARGLLYFAAPGRTYINHMESHTVYRQTYGRTI